MSETIPTKVTIFIETGSGSTMTVTQVQRVNDRGHPEETRADTLKRANADAMKWLRSAR